MSRFVSALKRFSDNELVADLLAFIVMVLFLAVALGFLAEASGNVSAWRLGQ